VLVKKQAFFGGQDPDILRSKNDLSRGLLALGRYKEALDMQLAILQANGHYRKACSVGEEVVTTITIIFGKTHLNTVTTMIRLAAFYYHRGLYRESLELAENSYEPAKRFLGEDHPDSLVSLPYSRVLHIFREA
jgi:hypothetical protein